MVVSDESINTYGLRVLTSGWKNKEQFLANPIMLFNHNRAWENDSDALPIGRWESITTEGNAIMAVPIIDDEDEGFGKAIAGKVERGVIKAASVGIRILTISTDPSVMLAGQTEPTITEWEMREISLVDIPANKNCVMFYDADGKEMQFADAVASVKPKVSPVTSNQLPKKMEGQDLTFVAGFLGLASGAKMTDVQDAILNLRTQNTNLKAENETLKGKVTAFELAEKAVQTTEANSLIEAALTDERISLESKPMWEQNFKDNHENAKRLLGLMSGKVLKLSDVPAGKGDKTDATARHNGKTFSELRKDQPEVLAKLKTENLAAFKELYRSEFKKEYAG